MTTEIAVPSRGSIEHLPPWIHGVGRAAPLPTDASSGLLLVGVHLDLVEAGQDRVKTPANLDTILDLVEAGQDRVEIRGSLGVVEDGLPEGVVHCLWHEV